MSTLNKLCLTAALTALTAPAWAALTLTGTGAYNLGSASGPGATPAGQTSCGNVNGQDALSFDGSGINSIGIHAYACESDWGIDFGSRSSGENTFFARGVASVTGTLTTADDGLFSFYIHPGEIGAFGSTAFTSGEFQKARLTIQLIIDGKKYLDEAWSAEVGAGGVITNSFTSGADTDVALSVGSSVLSGTGYFSYGLSGGQYAVDLGDGTHDISYIMTSEASGNILTTGICTAVLQGGGEGGQEPRLQRTAAVADDGEGPGPGEPFTSYCGAGARSGDPFPPIARAQPVDLPEPMSAGLALTALLAAAGACRRSAGKR
ncbi:MAG: hypothetical protein QM788_00980 [Roseateles sp.]|uniref:hypothetical protein n=1 Tax=Roseateles sp. TaxID=1971397 RepID=UPI0039ECA7FD